MPVGISFGKGAGADTFSPGHYGIMLNGDGRYNVFHHGPQEVVDLTGIDATYYVVASCRHVDVPVCAATDGTNTKIYQRQTTTWATIATINSRVVAGPQALVSFNSVLAVGFGRVNPYQFSTDVTVNGSAYTFTASSKTVANADSANAFWVQSSGVVTAQCAYTTSPNDVYFTTDLTNTDGTGTTATYLGTNNTTDNYVTSIIEDDSGRLLVGTRHTLWSLRGDYSRPERAIPEDFPDGPGEAGGTSDRLNFEGPQIMEGRIYYPVSGDELIEYDHGRINKYMAPKYQGKNIPRMNLPINAMLAIGNTLLLWIGSKNTATNRSVTYAPGGTSRIANTFGVTSELWYGQYMEGLWTWHGVQLVCTDPLRYAFFDEDSNMVYMASGDSESANVQMRRFQFFRDNPRFHLVSSQIVMSLGTAQCEVLGIDLGRPFDLKMVRHIYLQTLGLADAVPSAEVEYKLSDYFTTAAFESAFYTAVSDNDALNGRDFPVNSVFRTMDVRFVLLPSDASTDLFPILFGAELDIELTTERSKRPRR